MDTALLSVADSAKILNLTPDAVRALERKGKLRAMRTHSGMRLFDLGDVLNLARERRTLSRHAIVEELIGSVLTDVLDKLPHDRRAEAERVLTKRGLLL